MIDGTLFPEMENSPVENSPKEMPESDPWLLKFHQEAKGKGTAKAIEMFISLSSDADKDIFDDKAMEEKTKFKESARKGFLTNAEEKERLDLFLAIAQKTSLPYALNWTIRECLAMLVPTNAEESPWRKSSQ